MNLQNLTDTELLTNALELSTTTSGCREINNLEKQEILHEIRFTAGSDFTEKLEQAKTHPSNQTTGGLHLFPKDSSRIYYYLPA
ncbi:MAG: hypothetical protein R3A13_10345 [Bdellovibrionota bacterium]